MPFVRRSPIRPRMLVAVAGCVLVGTLIGLAGAGAKTGSGGGLIHACVANSGGAVRFVGPAGKCAKTEHSVAFNKQGAQGPHGVRGKPGKIGKQGKQGIQGIRGGVGPAGPAHSEVVAGPAVTLSGSEPTGSQAISTAGCDHAVNGDNVEAFGGGVIVTPHPASSVPDIVPLEASYPGNGVTGTSQATPATSGQGADAYTGIAVISRMFAGDSATVQAYVICGP